MERGVNSHRRIKEAADDQHARATIILGFIRIKYGNWTVKIYHRQLKWNFLSHYNYNLIDLGKDPTKPMKRERGSTIQRVLDILDTVAASEKPISATEINDVLNLPKATAHRLCAELETRGYLLKKINGKSYVPGNRLHDVAVGVLANSRFRATRHAILSALSKKVGETCNIAYPDGLYMAYSDRVETTAPLRLQFPLGMRFPLHCTASGKLYLSTLPKPRREAVVRKLNLERRAKNTITDADTLLSEIEQIRKTRVSIDNEELFDGVIAIAVPITDKQGRFYSSLAIQAPVYRVSYEDSHKYLPLLREAAEDLSSLTED